MLRRSTSLCIGESAMQNMHDKILIWSQKKADPSLDRLIFLLMKLYLDQFAHRNGCIGHPVRETPFVVIPCQDPHHIAVQHFGLV